MDIFTLKGLIDELNREGKNSIINKIYHNDNELFFKLYGAKDKKNLYINISPSNQSIFLTDKKFSSIQQNPTGFCMVLRKYLQGKRILNFSLLGFYRILNIEFEKNNLLIKFTGKSGDFILADRDLNVIYSYKEKNKIKKFEIPTVKLISNLEEFKNATKIKGLPPFAIKEIEYIKNLKGVEEAYYLYKKLINFDIELIPIKSGEKFYPFKLKHLKDTGEKKILNSFQEIFNFEFDLKKELLKIVKDKIKKIENALKKVTNELNEKKDFEKYLKYGELLKANLHKIKEKIDEVEVFDYYENKNIKIKLDKNLTPVENMEKFFSIGKKYKRAIDKLKERIEILENELSYYNDIAFFIENTDDLYELKAIYDDLSPEKKIKTQKSHYKPYKEIFFKGIKIVIGKSSKGNDYIIKKFKNPEYVWCHAKNVPGAHVIIIENYNNISKDVLEYACKLALENSRAKNNLKGEVIYTKLKYIKKPKNAYPGQVLVTKENVLFTRIDDESRNNK